MPPDERRRRPTPRRAARTFPPSADARWRLMAGNRFPPRASSSMSSPASAIPATPEFDCGSWVSLVIVGYAYSTRNSGSDRAANRHPNHFLSAACPTLIFTWIDHTDCQVVTASVEPLLG